MNYDKKTALEEWREGIEEKLAADEKLLIKLNDEIKTTYKSVQDMTVSANKTQVAMDAIVDLKRKIGVIENRIAKHKTALR